MANAQAAAASNGIESFILGEGWASESTSGSLCVSVCLSVRVGASGRDLGPARSSLEGSDLAGTYPGGLAGLMAPAVEGSVIGTLDGVPLSKHPVELLVGTHRVETKPDCQPAVVWMGPWQERIGRLGDSDHRFLFVRWY